MGLFDKKSSLFAEMTEVHERYPMACSDSAESKKGKKEEAKRPKPARQLNITEAAGGGFILSGPNWDERKAACENKKSLLAAVDAAFPESDDDEKDSKTEKSE